MTRHKTASEYTDTLTTAADLSPRALTFSRKLALAVLGCAATTWLAGPAGRLLVALPLLLFGPGYLVERALRLFPHPPPFVRPALWLGLSLSVVALAYEWVTALGLSLTPVVLQVLALGCGLGVLRQIWAESAAPPHDEAPPAKDGRAGLRPWSAVLLGVLALTLGLRFYQIRDLALPAWVDSVHHALMIRVAAERGQAPLSLAPYLPIDRMPYHWGYHVFVAALVRISGVDLPWAMLAAGQVLNALHVLTVAALAAGVWRRAAAGVAAGIVVGLLSIWPAYYVSWGRYTQLTGLLLLPPLLLVWRALLGRPARRLAAAVALLLAGLSLIHFLVLLMALCLMAVSATIWASAARRAVLAARLRLVAASAGLALALAGPWLWSLTARALAPSSGRSQPLTGTGAYYDLDQNLLWAGLNRWLIAIALLAALLGLWRHRRGAAELLAWVAGLLVLANPWLALYLLPAYGATLLARGVAGRRGPRVLAGAALLVLNPWLVHLPYIAILTNEVVVISLFLPIGALIGGGVGLLWAGAAAEQTPIGVDGASAAALRARSRRLAVARPLMVGALVVVALWGAWNQRDALNPITVLATPADVAAIAWVAEHTPADARFLINAAPWLVTGRGADGGWWLLPLTGRWTSTPPVIYDYGPPDYVREIQANTALVSQFRAGQEPQIYDLIDREGITYVYLGPNARPLTPAAFPSVEGFAKVYERAGVTIFAVRRRT